MGWLGDLLTVGLGAAGVDTNPSATKAQRELAEKQAIEAEKKRIAEQQMALLSLEQKKKNTYIIVGVGAAIVLVSVIIIAVAIKNKPVAATEIQTQI